MINDRTYMRRDQYTHGEFPILKFVIMLNIAFYILQVTAAHWFSSNAMIEFFALSQFSISNGFVWTLISYSFLHSTSNMFHLLFNMLIVFFIGRTLAPILGVKRFITLYLGTAFVGGLCWILLNFVLAKSSVPLVGASAAAMGLLFYFCMLFPEREMVVLLFFVIPIRIKPKILILVLLAIESISFLLFELPASSNYAIANSAHLGGMLGAFLFFNIFQANKTSFKSSGSIQIHQPEKKKKSKSIFAKKSYQINVSSRDDLKEQVDKILDKINTQGFAALNQEEKELLDKAKDLLSK